MSTVQFGALTIPIKMQLTDCQSALGEITGTGIAAICLASASDLYKEETPLPASSELGSIISRSSQGIVWDTGRLALIKDSARTQDEHLVADFLDTKTQLIIRIASTELPGQDTLNVKTIDHGLIQLLSTTPNYPLHTTLIGADANSVKRDFDTSSSFHDAGYQHSPAYESDHHRDDYSCLLYRGNLQFQLIPTHFSTWTPTVANLEIEPAGGLIQSIFNFIHNYVLSETCTENCPPSEADAEIKLTAACVISFTLWGRLRNHVSPRQVRNEAQWTIAEMTVGAAAAAGLGYLVYNASEG